MISASPIVCRDDVRCEESSVPAGNNIFGLLADDAKRFKRSFLDRPRPPNYHMNIHKFAFYPIPLVHFSNLLQAVWGSEIMRHLCIQIFGIVSAILGKVRKICMGPCFSRCELFSCVNHVSFLGWISICIGRVTLNPQFGSFFPHCASFWVDETILVSPIPSSGANCTTILLRNSAGYPATQTWVGLTDMTKNLVLINAWILVTGQNLMDFLAIWFTYISNGTNTNCVSVGKRPRHDYNLDVGKMRKPS